MAVFLGRAANLYPDRLMATYTPVSLAEARHLAAPLGLQVVSVEGIQAGSVNSNYALRLADGGRVFLRIYEEQSAEGARGEAALLGWLRERGVPAVGPLPTPAGAPEPTIQGRPAALFPWVEGEVCCQARVTPRHTHAIGQALARVHVAGGPEARPGRFRVADLLARCDVIEGSSAPELSAMAPRLRGWLREAEEQRSPDARRGLCHGDLFRDNVLWRGDQLAALLDFESASDEPFAFDLAVTVLAWCYGDDFSASLAGSLVTGYQSVRPLPPEDTSALFAESRLAALRFTTTRITDYAMRAHLGANVPRDYRRFLARFLAIDALGPTGWLRLLGMS